MELKVYKKNREFSDDTLDEVLQIIFKVLELDPNEYRIELTNFYEDTKQSADIKIIDKEGNVFAMIGHRSRQEKYMELYPFDITLRCLNRRGYKTEFAKVMEGCSDLNFYCFIVNGRVVRWVLIDMDAFRKAHDWNEDKQEWEPKEGIMRSYQKNTGPDDTDFWAYDMSTIKKYDNQVSPEDKIIIEHSTGYFSDVVSYGLTNAKNGGKFTYHKLKAKKDRKDGT